MRVAWMIFCFAVDVALWFAVPCAFLLVYVFLYHQPATAVVPHLELAGMPLLAVFDSARGLPVVAAAMAGPSPPWGPGAGAAKVIFLVSSRRPPRPESRERENIAWVAAYLISILAIRAT